jgi:hypothetical protein
MLCVCEQKVDLFNPGWEKKRGTFPLGMGLEGGGSKGKIQPTFPGHQRVPPTCVSEM